MTLFIVNVSVMNVYKQPSFESAVTTQALMGESCTIIDRKEKWVKIKQWDGYEGWAHPFYGVMKDVAYDASHFFTQLYGFVTGIDGAILRIINFGNRVKAEKKNGAYSVELPDGETGNLEYGLSSSVLNPTRESIVKLAKTFLGIPYRWGGKSPMGFDCSGFIQTIFKAHGIDLPRDAWQQADSFSHEIELENSEQGDLIFFAENKIITHVALCLGNEQFIHAKGWVRTNSLNPKKSDYSESLSSLVVKTVSINNVIHP